MKIGDLTIINLTGMRIQLRGTNLVFPPEEQAVGDEATRLHLSWAGLVEDPQTLAGTELVIVYPSHPSSDLHPAQTTAELPSLQKSKMYIVPDPVRRGHPNRCDLSSPGEAVYPSDENTLFVEHLVFNPIPDDY